MKSLIREFVRLTLNEEVGSDEQVARLRKWAEKNPSEEEQILLQHDVIPIKRSDDESLLGSGSFSDVYEVIWNGRHAAAKVTHSKSDVEAMEKMDELGDVYGFDHIAKVYDVITHENEKVKNSRFEITGRDPFIYIIIVEYLVRPPKSIEREYLYNAEGSLEWDDKGNPYSVHQDDPFEKERVSTFIDIDDIDKIIRDNSNIEEVPDETLESIHEKIVEIGRTGLRKREVIDQILNEINSLGITDQRVAKRIVKEILDQMYKEEQSRTIPSNFSRYERAKHFKNKREKGYKFKDPRVESLMNFLLKLEKEGIAKWSDVRIDNILMRPKSGELVIADPGIFLFL